MTADARRRMNTATATLALLAQASQQAEYASLLATPLERAQRQKVPLRRPGAASSAVGDGTGQADAHDARSLRLRRDELLARRVAERHAQAQNLRARHIAEAERLMRLHRDLTLRSVAESCWNVVFSRALHQSTTHHVRLRLDEEKRRAKETRAHATLVRAWRCFRCRTFASLLAALVRRERERELADDEERDLEVRISLARRKLQEDRFLAAAAREAKAAVIAAEASSTGASPAVLLSPSKMTSSELVLRRLLTNRTNRIRTKRNKGALDPRDRKAWMQELDVVPEVEMAAPLRPGLKPPKPKAPPSPQQPRRRKTPRDPAEYTVTSASSNWSSAAPLYADHLGAWKSQFLQGEEVGPQQFGAASSTPAPTAFQSALPSDWEKRATCYRQVRLEVLETYAQEFEQFCCKEADDSSSSDEEKGEDEEDFLSWRRQIAQAGSSGGVGEGRKKKKRTRKGGSCRSPPRRSRDPKLTLEAFKPTFAQHLTPGDDDEDSGLVTDASRDKEKRPWGWVGAARTKKVRISAVVDVVPLQNRLRVIENVAKKAVASAFRLGLEFALTRQRMQDALLNPVAPPTADEIVRNLRAVRSSGEPQAPAAPPPSWRRIVSDVYNKSVALHKQRLHHQHRTLRLSHGDYAMRERGVGEEKDQCSGGGGGGWQISFHEAKEVIKTCPLITAQGII